MIVAEIPGQFFARPIKIGERVPAFLLPLDPGVPHAMVDLQILLDRCYEEGRYNELAQYDYRDPFPPLTEEQQVWAKALLRARGIIT